MSIQSDRSLARLIWRQKLWEQDRTLITTEGDVVTILEHGEIDMHSDKFADCKLNINGMIRTGSVTTVNSGFLSDAGVLLQVVVNPSQRLCSATGELIPQLVLPVSDQLLKFSEELLTSRGACSEYLSSIDSCHRVGLFTRLLTERMERKVGELMQVHVDGNDNWNHTLYAMLFKAMGSPNNKEPFVELSNRVPYHKVSHEKGNQKSVEAMLLGGAGLLQTIESNDQYIRDVRVEFMHLQAKYDIKPMCHSDWSFTGYSNGFPNMRIVQLAAFINSHDFVFDNVIKCRSEVDLRRLFIAEAEPDWKRIFNINGLNLGKERVNVIGINLVAPIIFAYGQVMKEDHLVDMSLEFLENIPAENNRIVKGWSDGGVVIKSAFDSQAMIQLTNDYCKLSRCAECPVGKVRIKEKFNTVIK